MVNRRAAYTVAVFLVLTSLDNMAIAVLPPMYHAVAEGLRVSESSVGFVTAGSIVVLALTAAIWGYWSDRVSRKRLLLAGTFLWSAGIALSGASVSYAMLLWCHLGAAVGLGCIASVGFGIMSEFIQPARRGLVLGLWNVFQGVGVGLGVLLGGLLGSLGWRQPLFAASGLGLLFAVLALFAQEPRRGQAEGLGEAEGAAPAPVSVARVSYDLKMLLRKVPIILGRQSNGWIILQGLAAQLAFGSLIWLPRVFEAKAQAAAPAGGNAMAVGSLLAVMVNVAGIWSLLGGYLGDWWHERDLRGRALLSSATLLAGVPFYLAMLLVPLPAALGPGGGLTAGLNLALVAVLAVGLTSANGPNWMALINDVNPPEHRGTMMGIVSMVNGLARALGNAGTGVVIAALAGVLTPPWGHTAAMGLFMLAFIPSALCFLRAAKWLPGDITATRAALAARVTPALPLADHGA